MEASQSDARHRKVRSRSPPQKWYSVMSTSRVTSSYEELPPWLQDNNFLLDQHRPQLNSYWACFLSIFQLHTETVNIWTHMIGCVMFLVLATFYFTGSSNLQEKLTLSPFFLGAVLCMGFSFVYHTVSCHSPSVSKIFQNLDYCGISMLILGSMIPWICYGFHDHFRLKVTYLGFVSTLGAGATIISLLEHFSVPDYRAVRATVFASFGLAGAVPAVHIAVLGGWQMIEFEFPLIVMAIVYIAGSAVYAARVPERIFPGRCNVWFQSHQIFHVLVVIATFINYLGLMSFVHHHRQQQHALPQPK